MILSQPFVSLVEFDGMEDSFVSELCENEEGKDVESEKNQEEIEDKDEKICDEFYLQQIAFIEQSIDLSLMHFEAREYTSFTAGIELPPEV